MTIAYATVLIVFVAILLAASWQRQMRPGKQPLFPTNTLYWVSPICFIALWGLFATLEPLRYVPAPPTVFLAFIDLTLHGSLLQEAAISLGRVVIGFGLGALVGVCLGLAAGSSNISHSVIAPVNSFLRYIPPTAFIALLIVYFGLGESFKYVAIFLGVVFFIVQMTIDVVHNVDGHYLDLARTSGFTALQTFGLVTLPASLPGVVNVLRINLGAAWTFLVAAELIGAERGLGHLIQVSQRFSRLDDLYAGILAFGLIGLASDRLIASASRWAFPWSYLERRQ